MSNILITGGTGSLGSSLVAKLLTSNTKYNKIIVYSRSEHLQEKMKNDLSKRFSINRVRFLLGDIRDYRRLSFAINGNDIDTIINAAALKVVPKGEYDPIEFVKTNINGLQNIIEASLEHGVKKVMQVSTDKAVMPINLYGATKLTAEKMVVAANNLKGTGGPIFGFVRYGNVTNSNGSVIPLFVHQYKRFVPFTVTDKRMTRFWITLDEAADFVLKSTRCMTRNKNMFIPNMKAYSILTLCEAIGDSTYPVCYTGVRPGEKIHESILTQDECIKFPNIYTTSETAPKLAAEELRRLLIKEEIINPMYTYGKPISSRPRNRILRKEKELT